MARNFILNSNESNIDHQNADYLVHLLNTFVNLTFSDLGINSLIEGGDLVEQLGNILDGGKIESELGERYADVSLLCLRVLGNLSVNEVGKQFCIDNKLISRSFKFLSPGRTYEETLNTSLLIMSCSINLEGKRQIEEFENAEGTAVIIESLIAQLKSKEHDLRKNIVVTLTNLAELPNAF